VNGYVGSAKDDIAYSYDLTVSQKASSDLANDLKQFWGDSHQADVGGIARTLHFIGIGCWAGGAKAEKN
jgi:hypothetical protein